jgi:hypothetical protein
MIPQFANHSELPDEVLAELVCEDGGKKICSQIVSMLENYGELNVNEIVVCFWVVYERKVSRDSVLARLSELTQDGLIKRIKRGIYAPMKETP